MNILVSCKLEESVGIERRDGGGWRGAVQQVRSRLTGYLVENTFPEDDPGGGVVAAMVLAQRSAVPRTINEAFVRTGHVCRVDHVNSILRRIAVQFAEPLPFHAGEQQTGFEIDSVEEAESLMV